LKRTKSSDSSIFQPVKNGFSLLALKLISRRDNGKNDQFCQIFQEFAHSLPGVEGGIVRIQFEFGIAEPMEAVQTLIFWRS
jgi:hypothetical protein